MRNLSLGSVVNITKVAIVVHIHGQIFLFGIQVNFGLHSLIFFLVSTVFRWKKYFSLHLKLVISVSAKMAPLLKRCVKKIPKNGNHSRSNTHNREFYTGGILYISTLTQGRLTAHVHPENISSSFFFFLEVERPT